MHFQLAAQVRLAAARANGFAMHRGRLRGQRGTGHHAIVHRRAATRLRNRSTRMLAAQYP
jgi:hypothetical protein